MDTLFCNLDTLHVCPEPYLALLSQLRVQPCALVSPWHDQTTLRMVLDIAPYVQTAAQHHQDDMQLLQPVCIVVQRCCVLAVLDMTDAQWNAHLLTICENEISTR